MCGQPKEVDAKGKKENDTVLYRTVFDVVLDFEYFAIMQYPTKSDYSTFSTECFL